MRLVVAVVALVACRDAAAPADRRTPARPTSSPRICTTVAGADEATRKREVSVVDPRRDDVEPRSSSSRIARCTTSTSRAFDAQVPAMVAQLAPLGAVTARRHFAGDRKLDGRADPRCAGPCRSSSRAWSPSSRASRSIPCSSTTGRAGARSLGLDQIVLAARRGTRPRVRREARARRTAGTLHRGRLARRGCGAAAERRTFCTRVPAGDHALW